VGGGAVHPFDIKDVKIDFQVIGPLQDDPSKMDVLLVAAKTDLINDYMSVVRDAGLVPESSTSTRWPRETPSSSPIRFPTTRCRWSSTSERRS